MDIFCIYLSNSNLIMNSMKNKREIYEAMSDFEADQSGNEIQCKSEFGTEQEN